MWPGTLQSDEPLFSWFIACRVGGRILEYAAAEVDGQRLLSRRQPAAVVCLSLPKTPSALPYNDLRHLGELVPYARITDFSNKARSEAGGSAAGVARLRRQPRLHNDYAGRYYRKISGGDQTARFSFAESANTQRAGFYNLQRIAQRRQATV